MAGFFAVRNYETFQHYKDRNPPWIKSYYSILDSYEFAKLPDASKGHLFAIYLLASRNNNKIPADFEWLKSVLKANSEIDLSILTELKFIVPDQECSEMLAERKQNAPQRRGEDNKNSVAIATDVPSDPIKVFFDTGIALLLELNPSISEKAVRPVLGKLRQKFPEIADAQDALDAMADVRPADPVAWLMACSRSTLPPIRVLDPNEPVDPEFYGVAMESDCADIEAEWAAFRDHHAGRGTTFRSMVGLSRTWFRRAPEFRRKIYAVK